MGLLNWLFGKNLPPPEPIDHPALGRLEYCDSGWWEGKQIVSDGSAITVLVAGDRHGVDAKLAGCVVKAVRNWTPITEALRSFLTTQFKDVPWPKSDDFTPTGVSFLWPQEPMSFSVELELEGDEFGVNSVEFVDGEPKYYCRDD